MLISIRMPASTYGEIRNFLLRPVARNEEAGFLFAKPLGAERSLVFQHLEWWPLGTDDFEHQSEYHLELTDRTRARIIKHAHDLECSVVEFHSHPGPWPAQFSPSDFYGLQEFVPHMLWRLKQRPYAAVVVAPSGFDGLAWVGSLAACHLLAEIDLGQTKLRSTGLSMRSFRGTLRS